MDRQRGKQFLALLLSVVMLTSMIQVNAFAMSNDIQNHWAENAIQTWIDQGLVNGYPDGSFRPDTNITRAEYMALVNNAFNFSQEANISFTDVKPSDWYYTIISIAVDAGYISGYPDNTIKPEQPITRQEAATIIAKIQGLSENPLKADDLTDGSSIDNWSKGYIGAVVEAGYMKGYPDGTFKAKNPIKRGEAVFALNNTIKDNEELLAKSITYDKAGTYGPSQGKEVIEGNVTVKADKVILQNLHIKGNLIITEEVGTGDVTLNNITVEGDTIVRGGGKDSIHINGGSFKNIIIESTPTGGVRVVATNAEGVNIIIAESDSSSEVILEGTFDKVEVRSENAKVTTQGETKIESIVVEKKATITVAKGTTVQTVTLNAAATVTGSGTVKTANVNVSGTTITTKTQPITNVAEGASDPTTPTKTVGGSSTTPSTTQVSAITVTGDAVVGATLTAAPTPSAATGTYQWSISVTADGTYANINGATNQTYVPVTGDATKYVKVTITGTGSYTGTQTSAAKGEVTKADAVAPAAPTEVSKTATSVTLTANVLHQFSRDAGATWQDSAEFTGLMPSTQYTFVARAKETTTHNASAPSAGTVITTDADALAPVITAVSPSSGPAIGGTEITISGINFEGTTSVTIGGVPATNISITGTSITATTPSGTNGSKILVVTNGSGSGNSTFDYGSAPTIANISPPNGPTSGGTVITISGINFTGTTGITIDGTAAEFTVHSDILITATSPAGTAGLKDLIVTNLIGTDTKMFVYDTALPAMTGTVAITGDAKFGATLTVDSTGLTNGGTPTYRWKRDGVSINGATTSTYELVEADIATVITVSATAEATVGTGSITSDGTAAVTKADGPAAPSAPTEVSKTATSVTLTANALHQFSRDAGATWQDSAEFTGLMPSTQYTFVARAKETTTHNASAPSAGTVITTDADALAPVITAVSPSSGPAIGGTEITISGINFEGTTSVTIGGVPATNISVTGTSITATTPSGTNGSQILVVTNGSGSGNSTFDYGSAPTIANISPSNGPTSGGTVITISGINFTGTTGVTIDGVDATFTVDSDVTITAISPPGTVGVNKALVVTNLKGIDTTYFEYHTALPAMTGTVAITGDAKFGATLTADPAGLTNGGTPTYQWKRNGVSINGATALTYELVEADIATVITVSATAEATVGTGSITSDGTAAVTKADSPTAPSAPTEADSPTAPSAPTEASKTSSSVTLTANALHQFSRDAGATWQDIGEFTGLTASTEYTFLARVKETTTHNASAPSTGTEITTDAVASTVVTFESAAQAGGTSGTADSTGLTLTFSVDPTTLVAGDITVTGATKGALSGEGTTRTLAISDITVANGGTVSVGIINPSGYLISGSPQTAVVYKVLYTVTYDAGTENTSGTVPVDETAYDVGATVTVLGDLDEPGDLKGEEIGEWWKWYETTNMQLLGWNTQANGGGDMYYEGNTFIIIEDTTLYAIYTALGVEGPAGGLIFYDKGSYSDGWRYLEAAPESTEWTLKEWGEYGTWVTGTGKAIGTGRNNTTLIVAADPDNSDRAAQLADALTHGDPRWNWFLPSKDELNEMYLNLRLQSVGGFTRFNYWSSSERSGISAWCQSFSSGDQFTTNKGSSLRVRAVHAF